MARKIRAIGLQCARFLFNIWLYCGKLCYCENDIFPELATNLRSKTFCYRVARASISSACDKHHVRAHIYSAHICSAHRMASLLSLGTFTSAARAAIYKWSDGIAKGGLSTEMISRKRQHRLSKWFKLITLLHPTHFLIKRRRQTIIMNGRDIFQMIGTIKLFLWLIMVFKMVLALQKYQFNFIALKSTDDALNRINWTF